MLLCLSKHSYNIRNNMKFSYRAALKGFEKTLYKALLK